MRQIAIGNAFLPITFLTFKGQERPLRTLSYIVSEEYRTVSDSFGAIKIFVQSRHASKNKYEILEV